MGLSIGMHLCDTCFEHFCNGTIWLWLGYSAKKAKDAEGLLKLMANFYSQYLVSLGKVNH